MSVLYIMCGVGFSGKSTLAKKISEQTGAVLVSQDATYFANEAKMNLDQDSDQDWQTVLNICYGKIEEELAKGKSVVFDDTNHRLNLRNKLRDIADKYQAETKVISMNTSVEVQKERSEKNKITGERHEVKQEYLDTAIAELEAPTENENVIMVEPDYDLAKVLSQL